jgi:hypothetical protein
MGHVGKTVTQNVVSGSEITDGTVTGADLATNLDLSDSQKLRFGTGNDAQIFHDGNNTKLQHTGSGQLYIGSDTFNITNGATSTNHLIIDANGHVTMPLQTSFLAQPTSVQSNIASNSWVNIVFGTERYDVNGDFASPTFTAPVTGKYMMTFGLDLRQVPNDASGLYWVLATSNRTYYAVEDTSATLAETATNTAYNLSVVADFDANDTCTVMIWYNGTASIDCQTDSFWSGHLLG